MEFHFLHRRLDMDSLRRRFHGIDRVVEFDPDRRVFERMIERPEPLHLEWFRFARRHYFQVRQRPVAFRVEQAIYDEVECVSDWKWCARCHSKAGRLQRTRSLAFSRLNYFDWKTPPQFAVLKVNVLRGCIQTNRIS